jgi:hypothetical protein
MCKRSPHPYRCRQWIRRKEWRALKRIEKICPRAVCKHLGYCKTLLEDDDGASELTVKSKFDAVLGSPSLALEVLDQQLEAYLTENVCGEFKQAQALCIHVGASIDSRRYTKLYMAVLDNDTKWIDNDLQEEVKSVQAAANVGLCGACKNVVQSSTNLYLQILVSITYRL